MEVMMENQPHCTLEDEDSKRCPHPLYSWDSTQKHQENPQENQCDGLVVVKVEEEEYPYIKDDGYKKEQITPEISTDGSQDRFSYPLYPWDPTQEDPTIPHNKHWRTPASSLQISTDQKTDSATSLEDCHLTPSTKVRTKRKRIVLTLKQKLEICKRLEKGESRSVIMEEFNIGSSTIYDIKAKAQKIKEFYGKSESDMSVEKRYTLHTPKLEALDQALYEWFSWKRSEGRTITGPMLQEKARELHAKLNVEGQCTFSSGWLTRFKVRHGICRPELSGEPKPADFEAAAFFCDRFSELVEENGLSPEQIYNAGETGLMWKCLPDSTLTGRKEKVTLGFKLNKERLNVLVCANASGSHKLKLCVVGKPAKPKCFKGLTNLLVDYHAQRSGWVDADILTKWFHFSFVPSVEEHLQKKGLPEDTKVLLLLDNCRTHPPAEKLVNGNIFVHYFPSNVASVIQPMDQGVIQNVKMIYRRDFMRKMFNSDETVLDFQIKFSLKDAIHTVSCAWNSVKSETLQRSWTQLWPVVIPEEPSLDLNRSPVNSVTTSSNVYDEICELVNSAKDKLNLSPDELSSWLAGDETFSVNHTLTTDDILDAVVDCGKQGVVEEEESDDDDGCEVEKVSWLKATKAFETVIAFAEQQPFFTPQHIMQLLIMQNLTLQEKCKAPSLPDNPSFVNTDSHESTSTVSSTAVNSKPSSCTSSDHAQVMSLDPDAMSIQ